MRRWRSSSTRSPKATATARRSSAPPALRATATPCSAATRSTPTGTRPAPPTVASPSRAARSSGSRPPPSGRPTRASSTCRARRRRIRDGAARVRVRDRSRSSGRRPPHNPPPPMRVQLPDGSHRDLPDGATGPDLAADIGPGLARAAMAIRVLNGDGPEKRDGTAYDAGRIHDLSEPLEDGATVEIVTVKDGDGDALKLLRHDIAHVL